MKANNFHHYNMQNTSLVILFLGQKNGDKDAVGKLAAQMDLNFVWINRFLNATTVFKMF